MTIALDRIVLGDTLDLLKSLPNECLDLVVSSSYNLGKEYEAKKALEHYLEEQEAVLRECHRCLKDTGSIFWQVGAFSDRGALIPLDIRFFPILESFGMIPRNRIVWIRQHGLHGRQKFSCRHETVLWFTKTEKHKFFLDNIRVPQKYQNKKKAGKAKTKALLLVILTAKTPVTFGFSAMSNTTTKNKRYIRANSPKT